MRIRRLAALALLNLLNNLLHAWHLIAVLERNFNSILRSIHLPTIFSNTMDGEGGEQRDPIEQAQAEPMEEDIEDQVVMGLGYEDESGDEDDVDEEVDDNASDMSSDSDSDYIVEMDSDDAFESDNAAGYGGDYSTNSESDSEVGNKTFRSHWNLDPRYSVPNLPLYTFKPQRLLKCNYKKFCPPRDYPFARSGHRVVASESHLYTLGGYNPRNSRTIARGTGMLFQELWRYNFATKRWVLLHNPTTNRNMPRELASNALIISNNLLISYGGTGYPFGESCSNDCYIYQTQGEKPSVMRIEATGDAPIPQYGPGIVLHEHYLYTIGGTTGYDYSCDVHRLNLRTRVWECVYICRPDIREDPEGRYRHEVVYDGEYIYVLGGGTSHLVYDLQRIPAFNLKTNRWEYFDTLPDRTFLTNAAIARQNSGFPKPRKCFSCVQHTKSNGEVEAFITGGMLRDHVYFSDIWKLNFSTKQWTLIRTASLPKALYFHAAAHNQNGCMYIFGGIEYDEKRIRRCNDLYKMWMTVPKLSEICWEAVLHYRPNLKFNGHSQLLKMGIPLRFAQRLWHSSKTK
ncbi:kelch domain-containing protein 10 homolog [Rhagoletis pomonella]|uniref:kelch domain-containing protein 10 homolog n=1 Tax=Rhagoletis pomonella TaxID=28610 RepID=UPI0017862CEA|nr:kelch domain-containing protein 10 homolog [Rhagoletis pomonella]